MNTEQNRRNYMVNMRNILKTFPVITISLFLAACDIESVSVGDWNISVDTEFGMRSSVWTIAADGTITIAGDAIRVVNGAILEGSRISWSDEIPNPSDSGQVMRINFSGTVDGNNLQGTIFTTLGNLTVNGTRQ